MSGLRRELTDKEKIGLYSLVKYPNMNDRELTEVTGLNLSTITAIRRRLFSAGYYFTVRIPLVQHLGAELLTVAYGEISQSVPKKQRNQLFKKFADEHDTIFLCFTSDDFGVLMMISRNYTEVKNDVDELQHFLSTNDIISSNPWQYVLFPFEVSSILNLFDYSYLLQHIFHGEITDTPDINLKYQKCEKRNLTTKEKAALIGLVENPNLPDNGVAKKVGISRQALSSMKQKFEDEGLLKTLNIPDPSLIGAEILVFSHILFNPDCLLEDRKSGVKLVLEGSPVVFVISGSFESTLIHYVKNYDEYNMFKNKLISYYASKKFLRTVGNIELMSVGSLENHKKYDFSGILKNLLEI